MQKVLSNWPGISGLARKYSEPDAGDAP